MNNSMKLSTGSMKICLKRVDVLKCWKGLPQGIRNGNWPLRAQGTKSSLGYLFLYSKTNEVNFSAI
ncbi:hypothetical protein FPSE_01795 [Fusarium pseudograminearum CS3096]|uniref:Uncharacterized protein n=1 Tax=Fusarium pseudograminearum (strain CS3096) TaxID=1028729 RepID=K3VR18_FUSPC|nr:hypothetical protein FPSE_01795 [Fusarium pseudograminearum CS3096]EKJ78007.1 hypothetical protein FPSE_01795 [Fusarium pseudograminearum CS3096]